MTYISEIFAVLVLAGAAQAAPAAHAALSGSEEEPFHQEAWRKIDIAAFREMSLEQRLELHANHKVYDAEYTINCIKDCIIPNEGYRMYEATYGEVCKNKENRLAMSSYLGDVGHCMHEMETERRARENNDNSNDSNGETACSQAFDYFELKIDTMCDFINQETKVLDYPADDSWE
ncbi:hypothetical protein D6D06_00277 [Aureobasidium pullulans]|nr:hypothetical protein D6D06_00277 [Aureobasidium pullulans]THX84422.1 hypothetical protein D6D05_03197 [Aureobasidium pullulans]